VGANETDVQNGTIDLSIEYFGDELMKYPIAFEYSD